MKRDDIPAPSDVLDALVVGAGFSGLYAIHQLNKQGLKLRDSTDLEMKLVDSSTVGFDTDVYRMSSPL